MGDVALLVPVLSSLVQAHRDVEVVVATRPAFGPLFAGLDRVRVFPADVDGKFAGFGGARRLVRQLIAQSEYHLVLDLHDHVRTMIMRVFFRLFGYKVMVFDKGRAEKRAFTRKHNKVTAPLRHTIDRYRAAFEKAGFEFPMQKPPYQQPSAESKKIVNTWLHAHNPPLPSDHDPARQSWIGIAPFAAHKTKIWPLENYQSLMSHLLHRIDAHFFLLGHGDNEIKFFRQLKAAFPERCTIVAGEIPLSEELTLILKLDFLVTVDSANMHLATLCGTPVVSIWGGTDPAVGFAPYGSPRENIISIGRDELPCRPCSVYGKATCFRGDFACLTRITPEMVSARIFETVLPMR